MAKARTPMSTRTRSLQPWDVFHPINVTASCSRRSEQIPEPTRHEQV